MNPNDFIVIAIIVVVVVLAVILANKSSRQSALLLTISINNIKIKGHIMAVIAKPNQFALGEVTPQDRHGNPAPVQADSVGYESDNPEVCSVEEDPADEKKFKLNFLQVGFANVTVTADADLGDGVVAISSTVQVVVEPEQAVGFGLSISQPQDNPAEG